MDWIHLAQERNKWRAVVYTVLNFRVPQSPGNLFTNSGTNSSREGLFTNSSREGLLTNSSRDGLLTNSSREGLFSMQFVSQSVMFHYESAKQNATLAVPH